MCIYVNFFDKFPLQNNLKQVSLLPSLFSIALEYIISNLEDK
jgi:hypothetical protein